MAALFFMHIELIFCRKPWGECAKIHIAKLVLTKKRWTLYMDSVKSQRILKWRGQFSSFYLQCLFQRKHLVTPVSFPSCTKVHGFRTLSTRCFPMKRDISFEGNLSHCHFHEFFSKICQNSMPGPSLLLYVPLAICILALYSVCLR